MHDAVQDGELVVLHATMSGRQSGPFTAYAEDGSVEMVFPPRGREFAATQTHWFRMKDGKIAEHWANRDDLTTFTERHQVSDLVVVADAGMLSAANLNAIEDAGFSFIVGSRISKAPYDLAAHLGPY